MFGRGCGYVNELDLPVPPQPIGDTACRSRLGASPILACVVEMALRAPTASWIGWHSQREEWSRRCFEYGGAETRQRFAGDLSHLLKL